jgi:hypothetical protein
LHFVPVNCPLYSSLSKFNTFFSKPYVNNRSYFNLFITDKERFEANNQLFLGFTKAYPNE